MKTRQTLVLLVAIVFTGLGVLGCAQNVVETTTAAADAIALLAPQAVEHLCLPVHQPVEPLLDPLQGPAALRVGAGGLGQKLLRFRRIERIGRRGRAAAGLEGNAKRVWIARKNGKRVLFHLFFLNN